MPSGKEAPFISQENVRAALEGLLYTSAEKPPNPLLRLLLVAQFAARPEAPSGQSVLEFSLNRLLTGFIADELRNLRHTLGLSSLPFQPTQAEALTVLTADAKIEFPELIGWDWLYYHFVRVDLNIGYETFCEATHLEDRTVRRYQQHAIKRLTQRLIHDEWQVRTEQHARRLSGELPGGGQLLFIGRADVLSQIEASLSRAYPQHICITGMAGIGKSALAEVVLARQIRQERLEDLLWLHKPQSVAFVREYLAAHLLPETGQITLRDYLQLYPTAIVLDGIEETLLLDRSTMQSLLDELKPALVIVTSRIETELLDIVQISLNDLSAIEAEDLIASLLYQNRNSEADETDWYQIYEQTGGNPLAIKLFIANSRLFSQQAATIRSTEGLFNAIYEQLSPLQQLHWFMFALLPPGTITSDQLTELWPNILNRDAVASLLQNHLVEGVRPFQMGFVLPTAGRRFIEAQYRADEPVRLTIQTLINHLNSDTPHLANVIEYLLGCDWLVLELEHWRQWLWWLWQHGLDGEHWLIWRSLFERQRSALAFELELLLAYGVCLRHLGQPQAARQIFETIIFQTGRQGAFITQAQALLELARLSRREGEYEKALVFAQRAEKIATRYQDAQLLDSFQLERTQIAIDSGDLKGSRWLVSTLPNNKHGWFLQSEILLTQNNFERSRTMAQQILSESDCKIGEQARLHTLIGRTYEKQKDYENALACFSSTLTLLEREHDPFALSRAQTNLAAVLIHLAVWDEARELLTHAEATQIQVHDRLGLEITHHNLSLLAAHIAG